MIDSLLITTKFQLPSPSIACCLHICYKFTVIIGSSNSCRDSPLSNAKSVNFRQDRAASVSHLASEERIFSDKKLFLWVSELELVFAR